MKKMKAIITVCAFGLLVFTFSAMCYFSPDKDYTNSERRALKKMPPLNGETIYNGEFMSEFEPYTADQFPGREMFRTVKAVFSKYALQKKENNGLYFADGHISKLDNELNMDMLKYSSGLFRKIYDNNIKGTNSKVYFSIVPDKNMFLATNNKLPSINYTELEKTMKTETSDFMKFIPVSHLLSLDDYYKTDSHWKQENITDIAEYLASEMGADVKTEYKVKTLDNPFCGVYAGQSALPVKPDTIKYLSNSILENCVVTYYSTGKPERGELYNMEKAFSKDPYEMFLSGVEPLIEIENPAFDEKKELVIFRDSFGSSLAPLFVAGYSKITIVDVRYMQSAILKNFVKFNECDVLFIYSTTLLNNSLAMK